MYRIHLEKVQHLMAQPHPNGINTGAIRKGNTENLPEVGKPFFIETSTRFFITSNVVEIVDDNHFKTLNSMYYWKIEE